MDYTDFTAIKNRLAKSPNLCDLFKLISIETWSRMEYAYLKPRIKVFETTLTQNLIFTLNAYSEQYKLDIDIFEALDEKTNGNDFELIIRYPTEGVEFYAPIQAKKVYRNGKYNSVEHGDQIETLLKYAKKNKAKPLYLLFNYSSTKKLNTEDFGCTLVSAEYLYNNYYNKRTVFDRHRKSRQKWIIPTFDNLNPSPAFPWHDIVCETSAYNLLSKLINTGVVPKVEYTSSLPTNNIVNEEIGFYPIDTFSEQDNWTNLKSLTPEIVDQREKVYYVEAPVREIIRSNDEKAPEKAKVSRVFQPFAPQSRIIITKEQ
jgi:hypothetical protein